MSDLIFPLLAYGTALLFVIVILAILRPVIWWLFGIDRKIRLLEEIARNTSPQNRRS